VFGVGMTAVSLLVSIAVGKVVKNIWLHMSINTLIFSFNMFFIAWELNLALQLPFFLSWITSAIGEFVVMPIGIAIIDIIHKRLQCEKLISKRTSREAVTQTGTFS